MYDLVSTSHPHYEKLVGYYRMEDEALVDFSSNKLEQKMHGLWCISFRSGGVVFKKSELNCLL